MTSVLDVLYEAGTGASMRRVGDDAVCLLRPIAPTRLALIGGFTGATVFPLPSELLDWTSADVIELVWPGFVAARDWVMGDVGLADHAPTPVQSQLVEIKRTSGLTWGQVADAMGVEARAVHLWRQGRGISAEHEERLHQLGALIASLHRGAARDSRAELLEAAPNGSLLERLRAGESPRALIAAAPWRSRARDELQRNLVACADDGVLDEDYVFMLYLDEDSVREFADRATALLDDPAVTRRAWESTIDAQFTRMEQPATVVVEVEDDERLDDAPDGVSPLFEPAELGVPLGVGAIAGRRALNEGV